MITQPATPKTVWTRHGKGSVARGPALICATGAGESGKSRLVCSAPRACPERFGERAVYLAIDPESANLPSVLREDRDRMEVVTIDPNKDIYDQVKSIYMYDWKSEGITTLITDTMTVLAQIMLAQITNSGKFSDKHIQLASGVNAPMPGDFGGTHTLIMSLLHRQLQSGMNHITVFHDQEVRPEPGQPGDPIGGPATVGKGQVRSIVNWYNTVLHVVKQQKKRTSPTQPIEHEHVVYTSGHGIWQAKLRVSTPVNPVPCIVMDTDPANVWRTLNSIEQENK